ncbi:MAG: acyl-CoA dehydrogenase [Oceanicaulis sp.]|uniref:acyl-CoA dehydrogenase family protein n=1 Tax=unclassified Oceanicaulis TaxID=2632123 RepID=UPI0000668B2B|nr:MULTISPECIES: acyl-CoA dehydrogenase family protein [unclassified Oceanicaulis]EAP90772.1 acyl-CoA dehydrogenase family protein [Oceanicaulis alexandrii HTCC2633] [Oceanicaulis sp. HTCC2633]MAB69950.1 acyl-CoA dehydrogenase [Oceanicaulis sp.]MBG35864.1 acyl-CoA dehydrogenase [Oceanicaulis sp.]HBU60993.1 acyl-CoA dehydrogenase [Oceanicaulis sp.]
MNFEYSDLCKDYLARVRAFMDEHIYPNEPVYAAQMAAFGTDRWQVPAIIEDLKAKAKSAGLWNLFLPDSDEGAGLSNSDYAPLAEEMGRVPWASEVFNCAAPDTGNMEVFVRYGTEEHKQKWLKPLLAGDIRSAFLMTEPAVASADATNIECRIERDGDEYVINGRKWWSSGAGDPRCKVFIVMGKTNPDADVHSQQSMVVVPADAKGITIERFLPVFGYDDAPHGHMEIKLENVRVPASAILLGEGRGFEIAQGRLGPGRIHHCMRTIGAAERALELMVKRLMSREAFGKPIIKHSVWEGRIATARIEIEQCRLLTLKAAWMMDTVGNKVARGEIAMIKVAAPRMALKVIDDAIQAHGGCGVSNDTPLAYSYAGIRTLRMADGPDEVHERTISRLEAKKWLNG